MGHGRRGRAKGSLLGTRPGFHCGGLEWQRTGPWVGLSPKPQDLRKECSGMMHDQMTLGDYLQNIAAYLATGLFITGGGYFLSFL